MLAGNLADVPQGSFDWSKWTPGDSEAAAKVKGPGLQRLLDDKGLTSALDDLTQTQISRIGNALAASLSAGDSVDTAANSIAEVVDDDARAWVIADTEVARSMVAASMDTYTANDVTQWDLVTSDGACEDCIDVESNNPHDVSDDEDQPPNHPVCRCAASPHMGG